MQIINDLPKSEQSSLSLENMIIEDINVNEDFSSGSLNSEIDEEPKAEMNKLRFMYNDCDMFKASLLKKAS